MITAAVTPTERWKALAVKFGIDGLAGFVAGAIGLGVLTFRGGMRLITITSGRQGLPTENGAIAGDFTVEGTLFLVLAGAVLGMVLALMIGLVREGLPGQIWLGIFVFTPLLARLLIIDPDNIDFIRFGPAWVAIVAFTLGVAFYLALLAFLVNRFENNWRLPRPLLIVGGVVAAFCSSRSQVPGPPFSVSPESRRPASWSAGVGVRVRGMPH